MESQKRNLQITLPLSGSLPYVSSSSSPRPARPVSFPSNQFRASSSGDILSPSSIESSSVRPLGSNENDLVTPCHIKHNQPYRSEHQREHHQHQEGWPGPLPPSLSHIRHLGLSSPNRNRISIPNLLVEDLSPRQCVRELRRTIVAQEGPSMEVLANQDKNENADLVDDLLIAAGMNLSSTKRRRTGSSSGNEPNPTRTSFEFVGSPDQSATHGSTAVLTDRPPPFRSQRAAEISPTSVRLWTPEEDEILRSAVREYGVKNWVLVSRKCFNSRRTGSQIRSRYLNVLHPCRAKLPWANDEDEKLKELHQTYGNQWTLIASSMPNRVANDVKNRFRKFTK